MPNLKLLDLPTMIKCMRYSTLKNDPSSTLLGMPTTQGILAKLQKPQYKKLCIQHIGNALKACHKQCSTAVLWPGYGFFHAFTKWTVSCSSQIWSHSV